MGLRLDSAFRARGPSARRITLACRSSPPPQLDVSLRCGLSTRPFKLHPKTKGRLEICFPNPTVAEEGSEPPERVLAYDRQRQAYIIVALGCDLRLAVRE